jgi:hypothetical protein
MTTKEFQPTLRTINAMRSEERMKTLQELIALRDHVAEVSSTLLDMDKKFAMNHLLMGS